MIDRYMPVTKATGQKLPLGRVMMTRSIANVLTKDEIYNALAQHQSGDWGRLSTSDWDENDKAMNSGCRVLSAYETSHGVKFWIITEWDRSVTTVLLPDEY